MQIGHWGYGPHTARLSHWLAGGVGSNLIIGNFAWVSLSTKLEGKKACGNFAHGLPEAVLTDWILLQHHHESLEKVWAVISNGKTKSSTWNKRSVSPPCHVWGSQINNGAFPGA